MKKKPWEIGLSKEEIWKFEYILLCMERKESTICPRPEGVAGALGSGYCDRICFVLFPKLTKKYGRECPCLCLSLPHKIKVVRKLLAYNKEGGTNDQTNLKTNQTS